MGKIFLTLTHRKNKKTSAKIRRVAAVRLSGMHDLKTKKKTTKQVSAKFRLNWVTLMLKKKNEHVKEDEKEELFIPPHPES